MTLTLLLPPPSLLPFHSSPSVQMQMRLINKITMAAVSTANSLHNLLIALTTLRVHSSAHAAHGWESGSVVQYVGSFDNMSQLSQY